MQTVQDDGGGDGDGVVVVVVATMIGVNAYVDVCVRVCIDL